MVGHKLRCLSSVSSNYSKYNSLLQKIIGKQTKIKTTGRRGLLRSVYEKCVVVYLCKTLKLQQRREFQLNRYQLLASTAFKLLKRNYNVDYSCLNLVLSLLNREFLCNFDISKGLCRLFQPSKLLTLIVQSLQWWR